MKLLTIPWCEAEAKLILSFLVPSPLLTGLEHTNWNNKKPNWILQCTAEEPLQATAALAWRQRNPDNGDPAFPGDLPLLNPCHSCKEKSKSPNEHALRAHKEKKKKRNPSAITCLYSFHPHFPSAGSQRSAGPPKSNCEHCAIRRPCSGAASGANPLTDVKNIT